MARFDTFSSRYMVRAVLCMETALAVGGRMSLEPTGTDMPVVKGPDGRPFIPGSSIKGVIRFLTERLLRTWDLRPHLWACDPLANPCVPERQRGGRQGRQELWNAAEDAARRSGGNRSADDIFTEKLLQPQKTCTACRLFGSPWFAGRLSFKDAFLLNETDLPVVTQIRDGVGIDRDLGAAHSGIKYDFETVAPGARFAVQIVAENLDKQEMGLMLAVLRLWQRGGVAIGGKSTRGTGWGRLEDLEVERVDSSNLMDYLIHGTAAKENPDYLLQEFRSYLENCKKVSGDASD